MEFHTTACPTHHRYTFSSGGVCGLCGQSHERERFRLHRPLEEETCVTCDNFVRCVAGKTRQCESTQNVLIRTLRGAHFASSQNNPLKIKNAMCFMEEVNAALADYPIGAVVSGEVQGALEHTLGLVYFKEYKEKLSLCSNGTLILTQKGRMATDVTVVLPREA